MRCPDLAQRRNRSLVLWNDKFADTKRYIGVRMGIGEVPSGGKRTQAVSIWVDIEFGQGIQSLGVQGDKRRQL
jgi:hypothetical protein